MGPTRSGFIVENVSASEDVVDAVANNDEEDKVIEKDPVMPKSNHFNNIKNKHVRTAKALNFRKQKRKDQKEARLQRRKDGVEPAKPHTLETLREKDETTVGNVDDEDNFEIKRDLELDELAAYYQNSYEPKVLITFSDNPLRKTRIFGKELTRIIPNSEYRFRRRSAVKRILESAKRESYTDVIIVNEDQKQPNGFLLIHLPDGPTAHFRLSNCKITKEMKKNYREISLHRPEVILNNFTTRLGHTVGRMLGALFHYEPEFTGRRAVTFHNQRDYIFFRHHRYEFTADGKRAKLRELGPRFTLKLLSMQQGTFDSKYGDYEWMIAGRRHEMETSRRRFFL